MFYSPLTNAFYDSAIHGDAMPPDAVEITKTLHRELLAGQASGMKIAFDQTTNLPTLITPPPYVPTISELCHRIDAAADKSRGAVAGDPLRAVEYDRARAEAEAFKAANYQGSVPRMVAAWAINGRTARQAADSILAEANAYTEALYLIRETRLQAKEQIRAAILAGNIEQAQDIANETVASIEAAVAGIGNNT